MRTTECTDSGYPALLISYLAYTIRFGRRYNLRKISTVGGPN